MKINESLLKYYEKEFVALKKDALEFAKAHPLLASQLGLIEDELDDPHVERLIQAVAFLNARVNKNIDDHKKHLVDSLINILYPYYQRYVPSMAIVRFLVHGEIVTTNTYNKTTGMCAVFKKTNYKSQIFI